MVAAIGERTHEGEGGEVSFNIVPREYGDEASAVVEDEDGTLWVGTLMRVITTLK